MEAYFANLLLEKSVSEIVIVRDDAAICRKRRKDSDELLNDDNDDWQRPSSFKNTPEVNPAPIIPSRKGSNDSLSVLSTLSEEDPQKQNGFFGKFRRSFQYRRSKKQIGSEPVCITQDDIGVSSMREPQNRDEKKFRNSWDGTEVTFNDMWKDNVPPTLPLRKKSEDSLIEQSAGTSSVRCRQQRRSSMDNAMMFSNSKPKGPVQRRGSLDNSILMVDEQTKRHFQRRGSLDNSLLLSTLPLDASSIKQSSTEDNPTSLPIRQSRFQRRSSLDNAMVSSNNQAQLRAKRRSSMDMAFMHRQNAADEEPSFKHPFPRRSSLGNMPDRNFEPQDPPGLEASKLLLQVFANPPEPLQRNSSFKQRILSKLNSPKWQSKLSSDLFKVSSSTDAMDDDDSDDDSSSIGNVPGCRKISDDQMSLLSDDDTLINLAD